MSENEWLSSVDGTKMHVFLRLSNQFPLRKQWLLDIACRPYWYRKMDPVIRDTIEIWCRRRLEDLDKGALTEPLWLDVPEDRKIWDAIKEVGPAILRDIIGNPFRPVTFDPAWQTSTVTALAQAIYEEQAFDRLPILADALEDAGCTTADILGHCRGDGEHVRGCWVVDLVLGKE